MDSNKTERLLQSFEHEVSNIAEIATLKNDIQILNQELFTCSGDLKNSAESLRNKSEDLNGIGKEFSSLLNDLHGRIVGIHQSIETQLHHAVTRYETFLRSELLLVKDQIKLELKELSNEHDENFKELKLLYKQDARKTYKFLIVIITLLLLNGFGFIWLFYLK